MIPEQVIPGNKIAQTRYANRVVCYVTQSVFYYVKTTCTNVKLLTLLVQLKTFRISYNLWFLLSVKKV